MSDLYFPNPLIIVAGPFGCNKTQSINWIKDYLHKKGIPYKRKVISDAQSIRKALDYDHQINDGRDHRHPDQQVPGIHYHQPGDNQLDFIVTGDSIPTYMYTDFFDRTSIILPTHEITLAEWSGGQRGEESESQADYSYRTMMDRLLRGVYNPEWSTQTLAIIHPSVPDFAQRLYQNTLRQDQLPSQQEIEFGERSWPLPHDAMLLTAIDDFPDICSDLEHHLDLRSRIHSIENGGGEHYYAKLNKALDNIFQPWINIEGQPKNSGSEGHGRSPGWLK